MQAQKNVTLSLCYIQLLGVVKSMLKNSPSGSSFDQLSISSYLHIGFLAVRNQSNGYGPAVRGLFRLC